MENNLEDLFSKIKPVFAKDGAVKATISVTKDSQVMNSQGIVEKQTTILKEEKAEVEKKLMTGRPMYVSVDYGGTVNLGNYESAKVNISVSSPVGIEFTDDVVASIKKQIESCQKIAQGFIEKELADLRKDR